MPEVNLLICPRTINQQIHYTPPFSNHGQPLDLPPSSPRLRCTEVMSEESAQKSCQKKASWTPNPARRGHHPGTPRRDSDRKVSTSASGLRPSDKHGDKERGTRLAASSQPHTTKLTHILTRTFQWAFRRKRGPGEGNGIPSTLGWTGRQEEGRI